MPFSSRQGFFSQPAAEGEIVLQDLVYWIQYDDTNSYSGSGTLVYDVSGENNPATTLVNGPTFDSATNTMVFDGVDDYAITSNNFNTGRIGPNYTVLTWINLAQQITSANGRVDFLRGFDESDSGLFTTPLGSWSQLSNDGKMYHGLRYKKTNEQNNYYHTVTSTTTSWNAGDWYQIGYAFDDTTTSLKIYVNGVLENTTDISTSAGQFPINISGMPDGPATWDGWDTPPSGSTGTRNHPHSQAHWSVYERDLTAEEVELNYLRMRSTYG